MDTGPRLPRLGLVEGQAGKARSALLHVPSLSGFRSSPRYPSFTSKDKDVTDRSAQVHRKLMINLKTSEPQKNRSCSVRPFR